MFQLLRQNNVEWGRNVICKPQQMRTWKEKESVWSVQKHHINNQTKKNEADNDKYHPILLVIRTGFVTCIERIEFQSIAATPSLGCKTSLYLQNRPSNRNIPSFVGWIYILFNSPLPHKQHSFFFYSKNLTNWYRNRFPQSVPATKLLELGNSDFKIFSFPLKALKDLTHSHSHIRSVITKAVFPSVTNITKFECQFVFIQTCSPYYFLLVLSM